MFAEPNAGVTERKKKSTKTLGTNEFVQLAAVSTRFVSVLGSPTVSSEFARCFICIAGADSFLSSLHSDAPKKPKDVRTERLHAECLCLDKKLHIARESKHKRHQRGLWKVHVKWV